MNLFRSCAFRPELQCAVLHILVRTMPVIDGVLTIDERGNGQDGDQDETMACQEVTKGKAQKLAVVEFTGVQRQHDHRQKKRCEACSHLPFRVAPIRLAFLVLHHGKCSRLAADNPDTALQVWSLARLRLVAHVYDASMAACKGLPVPPLSTTVAENQLQMESFALRPRARAPLGRYLL